MALTGTINTLNLTADFLKGNSTAQSWGRKSAAEGDALYVVPLADYRDDFTLEFTGALSAGRNVELPLVDGAVKNVFNNTTGGFAITVLVHGATGVAIAAGKSALIRCNATDWVRMGPDVTP